jgi:hypothetical protein
MPFARLLLYEVLAGLLSGRLSNAFDSVYKMTFQTADPAGARDFAVTYLGAQYEISAGTKGCSNISWVNFSNTVGSRLAFEFHFVRNDKYPDGGMSVDQFADRMAKLHGNLESFDSFMDYHVTLATDDLDPVVSKLLADQKPMLVRQAHGHFSLFVEVPHGIMVEIVSPRLTILRPQTWDRCGVPQRPTAIDESALAQFREHRTSTITPMRPLRAVYASTSPAKDAEFFVSYFGGQRISEQDAAENALGTGNGTCYEVQAVRLRSNASMTITGITEFELWWINSPRVRHDEYTVAQHEKFLKAVHANISYQYDSYMDGHLGLWYGQSDAFIRRLQHEHVPFFSSGTFGAGPHGQVNYTGLFLVGPTGQTYEWLALNQTILPALPTWPNFACNGTIGPPPPVQIMV